MCPDIVFARLPVILTCGIVTALLGFILIKIEFHSHPLSVGSHAKKGIGYPMRVLISIVPSYTTEGRLNSESYQGFLQMIVEQTTQPLFLIHDGARYHTSAATQAFFAAHGDRITVEPLPSYSPDDNPIEYLWKKTKKRATHNQYFKEFAALTVSVDKALAYFATHPDTVLGLFGLYCEESDMELKQAA